MKWGLDGFRDQQQPLACRFFSGVARAFNRQLVEAQPIEQKLGMKIIAIAEMIVKTAFCHAELFCQPFDSNGLDPAIGENIKSRCQPI